MTFANTHRDMAADQKVRDYLKRNNSTDGLHNNKVINNGSGSSDPQS